MFSPMNLHNEHVLLTAHSVMLSDLSAIFPIVVLIELIFLFQRNQWIDMEYGQLARKPVGKYQAGLINNFSETHLTWI